MAVAARGAGGRRVGLAAVLLLPGAQKVAVPTVVGADQANAGGQAAPGRLPRSTPALKTAEQPQGQVIGQGPDGRDERPRRAPTVTLDGVRRPAQVAVPQVVGPDRLVGAATIEKAGVTSASSARRTSDTVAKGSVISVSPAEGQRVDERHVGHARRLQRARPQAAVPDVVGKELRRGVESTLQAGRVQRHAQGQGDRTDEDPGTVPQPGSQGGARRLDPGTPTVAPTRGQGAQPGRGPT